MVPSVFWKVILILPVGSNDVQCIDANTRVIAVWMPNTNAVGLEKWSTYRVSVDEIEKKTSLDFFKNVPVGIQKSIEQKTDIKEIMFAFDEVVFN